MRIATAGALLLLAASRLALGQIPLGEAVDAPALFWTTGGAAPWFGQSGVTRDGVDAAQSGGITHSQESWIETTLLGPGTLSFWWRVSSEANYDFLEFYLDGALQSGRISGEVQWASSSVSIGGGTHVARWRYAKDGNVSRGQDRAWIDQVTWTGSVPRVVPSVSLGPVSEFTASGAAFNAVVTDPNGHGRCSTVHKYRSPRWGRFDKALVDPFRPEYSELLSAARDRLAKGYEGSAAGSSSEHGV